MDQDKQTNMFGVDEGSDTTHRKIFVGGLAWKTENETMKSYFQQFGEILEAAVIMDKRTGKSKGYGFVTFKDEESAMIACQDPNPVIDGRRANCNLAYLGANKSRAVDTDHQEDGAMETASPTTRFMAHQYTPQYSYPYSAYGYTSYPQDMSTMSYYNAYGGQQYPSYYTGSSGYYYYNCYPTYAQHGQTSPTQNPKMINHPYSPQQYSSYGVPWPLTTSSSPSTSTAGVTATPPTAGEGASNVQDEKSSA